MIRRYLPQSTAELIRWYERYVSPVSLLVGFAIDAVAVQALDIWLYSFVLLFHLVLAGSGILLLTLVQGGVLRHPYVLSVSQFFPVVVQYAFGGLFSGFILLYSQSASFAVSWIFIVLLAALLIGNERFRRFYGTFPVQIGILYFALFSFLIFFVPILFSKIGHWTFVVSGIASVVALFGYLSLVSLITGTAAEHRRAVIRGVFGIFICINALYFLGAIPPLPLALRDAGVFHSIERAGDRYQVTFEPLAWYEFYRRYAPVFHRAPRESVYVYTAIFAPAGIATTILHEWQRYSAEESRWVTRSVYEFPITGGRGGGYRGYTERRDAEPGLWRVNVKTGYGQLIGRVSFEVESVDSRPFLREGEK